MWYLLIASAGYLAIMAAWVWLATHTRIFRRWF